jgi:hypothetical protein
MAEKYASEVALVYVLKLDQNLQLMDIHSTLINYGSSLVDANMSVAGLSLGKLAIILIIAGVVIVFAISGFQARDVLFAPNITEETEVIIKDEQSGTCTVQAADDVPRTINNCTYDVGDIISITYKREQPSILEHRLVREQ